MFPTLPAVSALSMPAMRICVKVLVNIIKAQISKKAKPPREVTSSVGTAFLYKPIG